MQGCSKLCDMIDYLMKEKSIIIDRSKGQIQEKGTNKSFSIGMRKFSYQIDKVTQKNSSNKSALIRTSELKVEEYQNLAEVQSSEEMKESSVTSEGIV